MPLYEYQCSDCHIIIEVLQSINTVQSSDWKCEQCGGQIARIMSPSSFVLKGTGWYKTDYKGK